MMLSLILIAFDREWSAFEQRYTQKLAQQSSYMKPAIIERIRRASIQLDCMETMATAQYNKWKAEGALMLPYSKNLSERCDSYSV